MKETIYTIPIQEALEQEGCPLCTLRKKLEDDGLQYILGPAMMEPDVRAMTNEQGFCACHLEKMMAAGNRLSLALVLQSRLARLMEIPAPAPDCFLCRRRDDALAKIYRNTLYLWRTRPDIREKLSHAPLCFPHVATLVQQAKTGLKKKEAAELAASLRYQSVLQQLHEDVSRFCRSFDHRFAGEDLGNAKTAVERAVAWLS